MPCQNKSVVRAAGLKIRFKFGQNLASNHLDNFCYHKGDCLYINTGSELVGE